MSPSDWPSGVKLLRMLAVAMAAALGALFAVGCLIGAVFEVQGFGRPAEDARPMYVAYSPSETTRSCVTRWSGHRCGGR